MSHLHFTATDTYKNRVIQLGEQPDRVFNVGGLGIDNIKKLNLLSKEEFEKSINFTLNKRNILVTFHPVTLETSTAKSQFQDLLTAISQLQNTHIIFTKSNSDIDGRIINTMIDDYVHNNSDTSLSFTSLGQLRYLSALQYVDAVVGNSSSGLAEAPSFKIGTINIGDRQKGRIMAKSIIGCDATTQSIRDAFTTLYSPHFIKTLQSVTSPYGNGGASTKIKDIIKKTSLKNILKKTFYDMKAMQ